MAAPSKSTTAMLAQVEEGVKTSDRGQAALRGCAAPLPLEDFTENPCLRSAFPPNPTGPNCQCHFELYAAAMSARFRSIDVMRGLAATGVVIFHAHREFGLGSAGVDIFFVISGFVIFHSCKGKAAGEFLLLRARRILPIYWVAASPWVLWPLMRGELEPGRFAEQALLAPMWVTGSTPIFIVAWTLVFECLFYAAAAMAIRLRTAAPQLAAFGTLSLAWGLSGDSRLAWIGNPIGVEFLIGLAVARAAKSETVGRIALAIGLPWLFLMSIGSPPTDVDGFAEAWCRVLYWGVPAGLIVYGAVSLEARLGHRFADWLCLLGSASYSIYLFHPYAMRFTGQAPWPLLFVSGLLVGVLAWAVIERPMMRLQASARRSATSTG